MATKYYQFDYAEMVGFEIKNMGIINVKCTKKVSTDTLKDLAKKHLASPFANIIISHITKITSAEFNEVTGYTI